MARHNFVNVIAFVQKEAAVNSNADGRTGLVGLTTIMSPREMYKSRTGYQCASVRFCARSQEERIVNIMETLKLYDIIELTGFLATKEKDKSKDIRICPNCGAVNKKEESCSKFGKMRAGGNVIFVYPISIRKLDHCDYEQAAFAYLHDNRDDVNRVFVMGHLTGAPYKGELQGGSKVYTRFQLAINRKYHPKGGIEVYDRTDYPWVYSYQNKAEKDFLNLEKGALVFVDGALQSRKYKELYTCQKCGEQFEIPGRTLEILSYDTEYLRIPGHESGKDVSKKEPKVNVALGMDSDEDFGENSDEESYVEPEVESDDNSGEETEENYDGSEGNEDF